ncbi:hypothetical protein EWM64_g1604 [Hericium alpestre]|uniref:Enoyl reductase (ER) domain-containing protein n=1 Tax=Hericium alpestre TaxID=135208 RepID=A0A4Z0A820_9AGAM|nr:hypothetical protein EWM64_g1604 [Hericium alpestre]
MAQLQTALLLNEKFGQYTVDQRPVPTPGPGDVLIEVYAASLNGIDNFIQRFGAFVETYPTVAGHEGVGIVRVLGDGVSNVREGDRVLFQCWFEADRGTYQQYSLAAAERIVRLPDSLSFDEAATLPVSFTTAAVGLYAPKSKHGGAALTPFWEEGGMGKYADQPIVILGGSSCVGQLAIQLAKLSGFNPIISTTSRRNSEYVKRAGATHIIDYHETPYSALKDEIVKITTMPLKIVYDAVSNEDTQKTAWEILAPNGSLIVLLPPADGLFGEEKEDGKRKILIFGNVNDPEHETSGFGRIVAQNLERLLAEGAIRPTAVEVLPNGLLGIQEGLNRLATGRGVSMPSPGFLFDCARIQHIPSPYTPSQVRSYLSRIGWPSIPDATGDRKKEDKNVVEFDANLANLQLLVYLHVITFPMDNSDLHYTKEHFMAVRPEPLYRRMVLERKGSYCFGQNGLLLGMLRGLGYRVYPVAGRVIEGPKQEYTAQLHLVLLVQPHRIPHELITYAVDVGFGGTGPVRPILLADGGTEECQHLAAGASDEWRGGWVWGSSPPERHRIVRGSYPASSLETSSSDHTAPRRDWHMQFAHTPLGKQPEWRTLYTFSEAEFFQQDIDAGSHVVSTCPGLFLDKLVNMRRFKVTVHEFKSAMANAESDEMDEADSDSVLKALDDLEGVRWMGKWTLDGSKATKRIGSFKLQEIEIENERQRVQTLREVFGLELKDGDEKWIQGRPAALPVRSA